MAALKHGFERIRVRQKCRSWFGIRRGHLPCDAVIARIQKRNDCYWFDAPEENRASKEVLRVCLPLALRSVSAEAVNSFRISAIFFGKWCGQLLHRTAVASSTHIPDTFAYFCLTPGPTRPFSKPLFFQGSTVSGKPR